MALLRLSLGDQALTCGSSQLCLDLFHLGVPWERASVPGGSILKLVT